MRTKLGGVALVLFLLVGCAADPEGRAEPNQGHEPDSDRDAVATATEADPREGRQRPTHVDPKRNGLEIVLGEWALSPEADVIRPGRVTFVIHNRGTMAHGFEIALEGDSSGHGSGDLFKAEGPLLRPGSSTEMSVDLGPGVYEIECLVDGHDDMGMEGVLEVRAGAPLQEIKHPVGQSGDAIAIRDFAFTPDQLAATVGREVAWTNDDVAPHTVTSTSGDFDSGTLEPGDSFSFGFKTAGTYRYRCLIHPDMKGSVTVR